MHADASSPGSGGVCGRSDRAIKVAGRRVRVAGQCGGWATSRARQGQMGARRTPTRWAGWRAEVEAKGGESPLERGSKWRIERREA